jgi:opacity protein-like surface antigen
MKRLVLMSFAAMMLAATAFAPVAMAATGDVEIQSVTLGTGGTVVITGTIECTEGMQYVVYGDVRQTTGNRTYNIGYYQYPETGYYASCQTTGPEPFTATAVGEKPFRKGDVLVRTQAFVCDPTGFCSGAPYVYQEFRIH